MMDCLIPARGGSKGIPNKNIIELNGIPLIAYTVHIAKKSNLINKVFVSTDSQEIAEIAKSFGATIPFIRPSYLASDNASDIEVFKHFINESEKLGFQIYATKGTAKALEKSDVKVKIVNKVLEGRPHIVDAILNKEIDMFKYKF